MLNISHHVCTSSYEYGLQFLMELNPHQSDLTDTSKRALATNRGKSETLKSTYGSLESEYKAKRSNLNAEQARFVRLMKTKLPAIKVSNDESESIHPPFLTPPNSPLAERQRTVLPTLVGNSHTRICRRRSKSFSDLSHTLNVHERETLGNMSRQKSCEHLGNDQETLTEKRMNFNGGRPRSLSAIDPTTEATGESLRKSRSDDGAERLIGNGSKTQVLAFGIGTARKHSSPARLTPINVDSIHKTRKLTSKKPIGEQLEDVKDLRYLRTGKYSSSPTMDGEGNMGNHE